MGRGQACRGDRRLLCWRRWRGRASMASSTVAVHFGATEIGIRWQRIDRGDVEMHPQRASLALMVATAHQALGQSAQTRVFVGLARQWGCEPQLIARALIAGVHNTLGRAVAAAGRQRSHALQHFADAIAAGGGAGSGEVALQDRVRRQLANMRLESDASWLLDGAARTASTALQPPSQRPELVDALRRSSELTLIRLKEQSQQLASVRRAIEATVRKEAANAVSQLEAHANLQRYLSEGQLMPELHGWPVSPDFAVMLIDLVESNDYDLVIEFGSGTSTLLMAIALARAAKRRRRSAPSVQVAFEHLEAFHQQTRSRLERAGVARRRATRTGSLAALDQCPRHGVRVLRLPGATGCHRARDAWSHRQGAGDRRWATRGDGQTRALPRIADRACVTAGRCDGCPAGRPCPPGGTGDLQDVACRSRGRWAPRRVCRHPPLKRVPA